MSLLSSQIDKYLSKGLLGFHSPAHCGKLHPRDLSELSGLDDLQYPQEVLKDSQDFVAELFNAQRSFYLINGASVGVQAALLSLTQSKKPILAARNIHKSVISGLILSGLEVEWFEPEWLSDWSVYGSFKIDTAETNKKYSALIVSNPSYEGFYSKLPDLAIPIIVDEAHGAHYHFSDSLPKPALACGADIVIQSWHKTLGSLTQTGVLHVNHNSKISSELIENNLRLLQSTSPSYLLLESLCTTAHIFKNRGQEIVEAAIDLSKQINFTNANNDDPLRVLFKIQGLSGVEIDEAFEENGIALESCGFNSALAFLNLYHQEANIDALNKAYDLVSRKQQKLAETKTHTMDFGKQIMNPRQAFFSTGQTLDLENCIGKISQELYAPCPPGIPLLVPGQEISKTNVGIIQKQACKDKVKVIDV